MILSNEAKCDVLNKAFEYIQKSKPEINGEATLCLYVDKAISYAARELIIHIQEKDWRELSDLCLKEIQRRKHKKVNVEITDDFI